MSSAITSFCNEHGLSDEQEIQLKNLFIDILLEKCTVQVRDFRLEEHPKPMEVDEPVRSSSAKKGKAKTSSTKKFSTVKTEEYARENDLCLDDFDIDGKITKNDVIQLIKKREKSYNEAGPSNAPVKKQKTTTEKISCHALTKTGDNCKTRAKADKPEGATFHYCPKHYDNWKMFEEQSDTEDEAEPEPEVDETPELTDNLTSLNLKPTNGEEDEFENENDPEKTEKYSSDEGEPDDAEENDAEEDDGDEVTEEDLFN